MLLLPVPALAGEPARSFARPGALLLNVTESDLNRIVADSFHANGGPIFEGSKRKTSAAVSGVSYRARVSQPSLVLGEGGTAFLTLAVEEGNLRIGRIERKIAGRSASCEDTSVYIDPSRPLEVTLGLDFRIEDGDLRIMPENLTLHDAGNRLNLVKPSHCTNALLPRWMLWWFGKPTLRRYLGELDEILLARARKSAIKIEEKHDLLRKSWEINGARELHLFPASLDTGHGSLFVNMTASSALPAAGASPASLPPGLPAQRSYVALSETITNDLARIAVERMSAERLRPTGNLGKLLRSSSMYALIPGLRGLDPNDTLFYSVAIHGVPRIEFTTDSGGQATIRLKLADLKLRLFKEEAHATSLLGTLAVRSGSIAVVPYRNLLGGVSFRTVENEWKVSSSGIRFDDALVAATLQELTFGRIFETTYKPLAASSWRIARTGFAPRAFDVVGEYLVIELEEPRADHEVRAAQAPMRTGSLPASR